MRLTVTINYDDKEKAIQKACCLMTGLVFDQPFKNGNKRTSVAIIIANENQSLCYWIHTGRKTENFL